MLIVYSRQHVPLMFYINFDYFKNSFIFYRYMYFISKARQPSKQVGVAQTWNWVLALIFQLMCNKSIQIIHLSIYWKAHTSCPSERPWDKQDAYEVL